MNVQDSTHPSGKARVTNRYSRFEHCETDQSIPSRFDKQVAENPQRTAIAHGDQSVSYGDLNAASNRFAHAILARCGAGAKPVGLLVTQGIDLVCAILGILKAGKFYVPIDAALPEQSLREILDDAQADLVVADGRHVSLAQNLMADGSRVLAITDIDQSSTLSNPEIDIAPDARAYIYFTSGSTGRPKGVADSHRNVLHNVMRYTNSLHIASDDRMTLLQSPSFSGAVSSLFGALLNGATVYPFDLKADGWSRIAHWLNQNQITIYHSVPSIFRLLERSGSTFPSVRMIRLEGDQASLADIELYHKCFSTDCLLVNGWGATECGIIRQYFMNQQTRLEGNVVPIGYGVEDMEVFLVDDTGQPVAAGEIGEMAVRSRFLAEGYWRQPDLTATAFSIDPQDGERRVFRTGDMARMHADGCVESLGRKNMDAKIRGTRVEVSDIEAALIQMPEIDQAVAVIHPGPYGENRLIAYVVPRGDARLTVSAIRKHLVPVLPELLIPSAFVTLSVLPKTKHGKIDRRALAEPDISRPQLDDAYVAPRNDIERQLADVWARVLNLDRVGIYDSFLELGGHSLKAFEILSRVYEVLGVELTLDVMFSSPTVAKSAEMVQSMSVNASAQTRSKIVPINRGDSGDSEGPLPLSSAQHGLWIDDQFAPGQATYNMHLAIRITGPLQYELLQQALGEVVRRHETLRSRFESYGGSERVIIDETSPMTLPTIDLRNVNGKELEDRIARHAREHASEPFDLAKGPLFKFELLVVNDCDHVLLLNVHHIVSDGWSMGLLIEELMKLYDAAVAGRPLLLAPLPIQYVDYAD